MINPLFLRSIITISAVFLATSVRAEWVDMEFPRSSGFSNTYIDPTTLQFRLGTRSIWWVSDTPNASEFSSLSFLTEFNCTTELHRNLLAYAHTAPKGGGNRIALSNNEPWVVVNPRTKASFIMALVCLTSNPSGRN